MSFEFLTALDRERVKRLTAFCIAAAALCAGCTVSPVYRSTLARPHKDVAVVQVNLAARLDGGGYEAIAERELHRLLGPESPLSPQAVSLQATATAPAAGPISPYEVRVEFFVPSGDGDDEKVATFLWRRRPVPPIAFGSLAVTAGSEDAFERSLVLY
jgi:hypothetical protein